MQDIPDYHSKCPMNNEFSSVTGGMCEFQPLFSGNLSNSSLPSLVHTHSRALCRAGPLRISGFSLTLAFSSPALSPVPSGCLSLTRLSAQSPQLQGSCRFWLVFWSCDATWKHNQGRDPEQPQTSAQLLSVSPIQTLTRPVLLSFWDQSSVAHQSLPFFL